jgi:hypothetical protein
MGTRLEKVVLSGPNPAGAWFWRPLEGGGTQPVPEALVDHTWAAGDIVEMQIRRKGSTIELVGPPEPAPEALLYVDGEPYIPPDTLDLEPGVIVVADIPYGGIEDRTDPNATSKNRPAVVIQVERDFVVVRALFSHNTEGKGQRLKDSKSVGLDHRSILEHAETMIPRSDIHELIGTLADIDKKWVLR